MNLVVEIGRLTKAPKVTYTQDSLAIARFTLAVDRDYKREGQQTADFINCVAFGKQAEIAEKYLDKGSKVGVIGRIQTGSYKAQDGRTVYTTDVVVNSYEFMGKKADTSTQSVTEGFKSADDMELPFV